MALNYRLIKFSTLTIYRKEQNTYVRGKVVEGAETTFDIQAKVQPLKNTEIMILPESLRNRSWLKLYIQEASGLTIPALRCAQQGPNGFSADEFEWQGFRYEVMKDLNYNDSILDHTRALAARKEVSAGVV